MAQQLQLTIGQYSDKGRKEVNQDFHDARVPSGTLLATKGIALALADGISSSDVSQEASKIAVTSFLSDYYSTPESWPVKKSGARVLRAINSWLFTQSRQGERRFDRDKGYICTFSGMIVRANTAHLFHIGDGRIYRLREGIAEQMTEDHRLVISGSESYLSRAMGLDSQLMLDYIPVDVEKDDIFLFTTDGIYEHLDDAAMMSVIFQNRHDLDLAAKLLVEAAFEAGSGDNLTVQLAHITSLPGNDAVAMHSELAQKPFPPALKADMDFDGFTIVRELSFNSRSHVYLATDTMSGEQVVIKCPSMELRENQAYLERLIMEEWVAKRISNPHVLKAHRQQHPRNYIYTVMQYVEGQTLAQWIVDNPRPSLAKVREIVEQIAKGMQALHRQEMLHQDIRPENIIIDDAGTIKIIDFGSTRVNGIVDVNTILDHDQILGTAQYSAPEYFIGETGSTRSDLYSLAVIIYRMLSGKFPYGPHVARTASKSAQKRLKYASLHTDEYDIPQWIDETLRKALQVDPYKRYEELSEFIYDLRHPNPAYLRKARAPIYERSPVLFWKSVSVIEAGLIIGLLIHYMG